MPDFITLESRDTVAILTFTRPEVRNALHFGMAEEASAALAGLNADPGCRAVVLTGAGEHAFCAGMDIALLRTLDAAQTGDWMTHLKRFYEAIRGLDKPSVAAVNGVAAGAGYQIALLADIRVGHAKARMGQPEINVGVPSLLGAHLMEATLGLSRTTELTLSGRLMDGEECHRLGPFHELVAADQVRDKALDIAHVLAAKSPVAMRLTKQRFREASQAGFDAAFEAFARLQAEAFASGEPQAVMAKFFER